MIFLGIGKRWVDRRTARHPNEPVTRWTSGVDTKRRQGDPPSPSSSYFESVRHPTEPQEREPRPMSPPTEGKKGFPTGVVTTTKGVFPRERYDPGKRKAPTLGRLSIPDPERP